MRIESPLGPCFVRDDALAALLRADHACARTFLLRAFRLTRSTTRPDTVARVACEVDAFFRYWNPLHELDEEQIVGPALAARLPADAGKETLARVIAEHEGLDKHRGRLVALCELLASGTVPLDDIAGDLRAAARTLARALGAHMAWEERDFIPRIDTCLPPPIRESILRVIRERRARDHDGGALRAERGAGP